MILSRTFAPTGARWLHNSSNMQRYSKEVLKVYQCWDRLKPQERAIRMVKPLAEILNEQGLTVPKVQVKRGVQPAMIFGPFFYEYLVGYYLFSQHTITVLTDLFEKKKIPAKEIVELAGVFYHEMRHSQQFSSMMRLYPEMQEIDPAFFQKEKALPFQDPSDPYRIIGERTAEERFNDDGTMTRFEKSLQRKGFTEEDAHRVQDLFIEQLRLDLFRELSEMT